MRCIIVEDELLSRSTLEELIKRHCAELEVVALCKDGTEGLDAIRSLEPDLVFLDIEMPNMNGFEMLAEFDQVDFDVIFTTAYDEFAVKAFKVSAVDYLLKPIDEEELQRSVRRAVEKQSSFMSREHVELLLSNVQAGERHEKIAIPSLDGIDFVDIEDILRCEADRNYTTIFTIQGETYIYSKTIKEFERFLPDDMFFRTHNSHVVNLQYIKKYLRGKGGELVLKDGSVVPVARLRKESLLKKIMQR